MIEIAWTLTHKFMHRDINGQANRSVEAFQNFAKWQSVDEDKRTFAGGAAVVRQGLPPIRIVRSANSGSPLQPFRGGRAGCQTAFAAMFPQPPPPCP